MIKCHLIEQRDTERQRDTDTERHRETQTQRDTESHRETQTQRHRDTHRDTERDTARHRKTQRDTERKAGGGGERESALARQHEVRGGVRERDGKRREEKNRR